MDRIRIYHTDNTRIEAVANILNVDTEDVIDDFMSESWKEFVKGYLDDTEKEKYREETGDEL